MQIVDMPIGELHPYENNPRINDDAVGYVANSISEFGFKVPVIIDRGGVVIAGYTRLKAAEALGMSEVPCVVADDLTPEQVKAFRLADNKVAEYSEWDSGKLDEELAGLLDFDMEQFGFLDEDGGEDELGEEYSQNLGEVEYEPKDVRREPSELYEPCDAYDEVIAAVDDPEIRKMLKSRQEWFARFDYAKIADYYAYQASADEQRAFEALGLVLLDRDGLIANGFASIVEEFAGGVRG